MAEQPGQTSTLDRRRVLQSLAALGIGGAVFQRSLAAQVEQQGAITAQMVQQAEWVAGLELTEEQRESTAAAVTRLQRDLASLRKVDVGYEVAPALAFYPTMPQQHSAELPSREVRLLESAPLKRPRGEDDLAFLPVSELAPLVRTRQISSTELTRFYIDRLERYDSQLLCVVSYTEELALRQARQADREIAAGRYRGPLHGIPWGAKDLIAYPGYKTTWGALPFKEQRLDVKATVARRLDEAGAVLVAKLTLGALAWGDHWFGGVTRNPWDVRQGSSGSSAGSASATSAGLVGFSIGSETLGSIVSPCRRCGVTGLRPTFGRVSRHGCMPLAWSMDKLGPICRSVEDCALVFSAIHGYDGLDPTAVTAPFHWPPRRDVRTLRVGYVPQEGKVESREELRVLKDLGVQLVPIRLPSDFPVWALTLILNVEAAAVFDEFTRRGETKGLNRWPNVFRQGEFTPAVEYLRANRVRSQLMAAMNDVMKDVDAYVGGNDLAITNLTGHPTVVLPNGFRKGGQVERPVALTFTGRLFEEESLLSLAHAYQQATDFHLRRPPVKPREDPPRP